MSESETPEIPAVLMVKLSSNPNPVTPEEWEEFVKAVQASGRNVSQYVRQWIKVSGKDPERYFPFELPTMTQAQPTGTPSGARVVSCEQ